MRKQAIKTLLMESGLIVFSVLLALLIDRLTEQNKTNAQKSIAFTRIHQEITANQSLVKEVLSRHKLILANLTRASTTPNDSFRIKLAKEAYIDWTLLAEGKSIYPRFPASTSWETAKVTGILAELDYQVVEACTDVYSSQQTIIEVTLPNIIDELFDVENTEVDRKLMKLRLQFEELIAQEQTLLERLAIASKRTQ